MTSKKENNKSSMPKWLNELDWDKMSQSKKIGIIAASVFILLLLAAIGGGAKPPEQGGTTNTTAEPTASATPDEPSKPTPTPTPKITKEQENAQKSAEGYAMMNMSRQGVIDQLVFDKFSKADAEWAVKQLDEGVSWKENALGSAKTYYGKMNMSKSAVYDQLLFDKFTKEEAQYAIDNL